jgi:hypothetical protein
MNARRVGANCIVFISGVPFGRSLYHKFAEGKENMRTDKIADEYALSVRMREAKHLMNALSLPRQRVTFT